jgi:hypothetical protein
MMVYDSAAGYICRSNHTKTVELPKEADDICNKLLPILKAVYQSRLMMENTSKLVKQKPTDIDDDIDHYKTILPSFISEGSKRKRKKKSDDSTEE